MEMESKPRYQKGQIVWGYKLDTIALDVIGGAVHKYKIASDGYQGHDAVMYKAKRISEGKTASRSSEVYEYLLFDNELDAHLALQQALLFQLADYVERMKRLTTKIDAISTDMQLIRRGVTKVF